VCLKGKSGEKDRHNQQVYINVLAAGGRPNAREGVGQVMPVYVKTGPPDSGTDVLATNCRGGSSGKIRKAAAVHHVRNV
jgi:hypothetical protein